MQSVINAFLKEGKYKSPTSLCALFNHFKSDKSNPGRHNYGTLYHYLFNYVSCIRYKHDLRFLEIGLGTNNVDMKSNMGTDGTPLASVNAFREYFPRTASIWGVDYDPRIIPADGISDSGVNCRVMDITSRSSINEFLADCHYIEYFDVILDDSLHEFHAGKNGLDCLFHKINPEGGLYIIEDITRHDLTLYVEYMEKFKKKFNIDFAIAPLPLKSNVIDNNVLVIQRKSE